MRVASAIACLALAACSRERPAGGDVDLNAAALEAQDDIANYAVSRRHGRLRHPSSSGGTEPVGPIRR